MKAWETALVAVGGTVGGLFVLWNIAGLFVGRLMVENHKYEVIGKMKGNRKVEVRKYEPSIRATCEVPNMGREGSSVGFRTIAGYIFGKNTKRSSGENEKVAMTAPVLMEDKDAEKISMTAPVLMEGKESEKVAMTAPVLMQDSEGESARMSFVMPSKYKSISDLPTPLSDKVKLIEVPAYTAISLRYTGNFKKETLDKKEKELLDILAGKGIKVVGRPMRAGYDPPFSPPYMKRSEVIAKIDIDAVQALHLLNGE
mmetsp:Transcript_8796/g.23797  ORF Transcript_8796/g.23797 Transcript_8796/m.23797 type:complete len:256 (-) Transcript_8796:2128-2895(-)|eukprot:CAMPEP_0113885270 /NCGR_PEP_ID=MMETSP0780_2-20120614/10806_1 /TAXON_ID=652834 /ORGANISM="Palpitomonas bilix" /LENGTH=255 /DNA_ID=CAMNT_0000873155 /DNA_START=50 /DNA_END=817 /DNA_ORIENTATION=+ /assembly_acc=CAM_ASM_000599